MIDAVELKCEVLFGGVTWGSGVFYRDSMLLDEVNISFDRVNVKVNFSSSVFSGAPFEDFCLEIVCHGVVQFLKIDRQFYESRGLENVLGCAAYGISRIQENPDFFGFEGGRPYISIALYDDIIIIKCSSIDFNTPSPILNFKLMS